MGPRSDNRGYVGGFAHVLGQTKALQWVHGPITVVMQTSFRENRPAEGASMGPRSDNRGYDFGDQAIFRHVRASMGPRSDNRGYAGYLCFFLPSLHSFNGSTVR